MNPAALEILLDILAGRLHPALHAMDGSVELVIVIDETCEMRIGGLESMDLVRLLRELFMDVMRSVAHIRIPFVQLCRQRRAGPGVSTKVGEVRASFSFHSLRLRQRSAMHKFLVIAVSLGLSGGAHAQAAGPWQDCVQPRELHDVVAARTLVAPATAVMTARRQVPGADVVRANLCRSNDTLVYVIVALRKDGRAVQVTIDGASGRVKSVD
jgi:hypothetical protein